MSAVSSRPSYAAVLRIPHARRAFAAALAARLSYGMLPLAVMLCVTRSTGSYAVAGVVMAVFGAMVVFLSPYRAALVDRYGPRRALLPMALLYAGLLCALAAVSRRPGAPAVVLVATAAVTGACAPPLGPTMRTVWRELAPGRLLLQRAYSLDGVAEELLYVIGPLLVGVLVGFTAPTVGVLLGALLIAVGTFAFVTSPAVGAVRPARREKSAGEGRRTALAPGRGLLEPIVVSAGVGVSLSAVDLLVVAFAGQRHFGDDTVAWVLAALSAGSVVGGLLNGAVDWRTSARVRLPLLSVGLGLALAAAGLAPGVLTLAAAAACAGLFVAPALTTAYLIADEAAPPGFRTQAGAWVNTAVNAGSSAGAAVTGLLVERLPLWVCFAVAGGVAVGAGALSASARVASARTAGSDDAGRATAARPALEDEALRGEAGGWERSPQGREG